MHILTLNMKFSYIELKWSYDKWINPSYPNIIGLPGNSQYDEYISSREGGWVYTEWNYIRHEWNSRFCSGWDGFTPCLVVLALSTFHLLKGPKPATSDIFTTD